MTLEQHAVYEAVRKLDAMPDDGDAEILHGDADDILCDTLRKLGAGAVADAFERAANRVGFWYA
jgi:hypothetical protein